MKPLLTVFFTLIISFLALNSQAQFTTETPEASPPPNVSLLSPEAASLG